MVLLPGILLILLGLSCALLMHGYRGLRSLGPLLEVYLKSGKEVISGNQLLARRRTGQAIRIWGLRVAVLMLIVALPYDFFLISKAVLAVEVLMKEQAAAGNVFLAWSLLAATVSFLPLALIVIRKFLKKLRLNNAILRGMDVGIWPEEEKKVLDGRLSPFVAAIIFLTFYWFVIYGLFVGPELLRVIVEDIARSVQCMKGVEAIIHPQGIHDFSEGLACVEYEGRYGYVDKAGNWAVAPTFEDADAFCQGLARVKVDGAWGYINRAGEMVVEPRFQEALSFSEGLAMVRLEGKCGFIDESGMLVIPPRFDDAGSFTEGLCPVGVRRRGEWMDYGYIDRSGDFVIEPKFWSVSVFREGKASVTADTNNYRRFFIGYAWEYDSEARAEKILDNICEWYIDHAGNPVIIKRFQGAMPYSEGRALVMEDGGYVFIDSSGREAFTVCGQFSGFFFREGTVYFYGEGGYGYLDLQGNVVVEPRFDGASNFSEGLAAVAVGDKYGYIDKTGNMVIPPCYEEARDFHEGLAYVAVGEKRAFIDKAGNEVIMIKPPREALP